MKKLTESDLIAIVDHELANSIGNFDSKLSATRIEAMQYYMGEAVGKLSPSEIEGTSSVVSRDVMDTIEWIMPSLMRIFTGGDDVVEFEPVGLEDEALAQQATDWVNYVLQKKNPGFILFHGWFKDALINKLGVVKSWWDESEDVTTESYSGLSIEEITMMLQDGDMEITEQAINEMGQYDITVKKTKKVGKICVVNVPPEEFLFNRDARSAEEITAATHRKRVTVSDLRAMGYKNVDRLMDDDSGAEISEEAQIRDDDYNEFNTNYDAPRDETMRQVWITETYMKVDWNGDGIAEWRMITKSGSVVLENEECDGHPFDVITPILMPHRMVGLSIADMVKDLQEIKTALLRQMLDSTYLANNPRLYVDESAGVNIDDVLDARIGGIVRGRGPNGVTPIQNMPLNPINFTLMEYVDSIRENRTGVTRYNQGVDANSLNKTATGINAIMGAAQQRIELIARVFAETGFKSLCLRVLKLSSKHETEPQIVRLRNSYVQIDPRAWSTQYDVNVSVGVGTGNKDQTVAHLMNVLGVQQQALASGLPIVTPDKVYNAAKRMVEALGFKNGDMFFMDPNSPEAQQLAQQKAQQPNPEVMKMQMEGQMKQAEMQQDAQIEGAKLQLGQQEAVSKVEVEKYKLQLEQEKLALEKMKLLIEADRIQAEANTKALSSDDDIKGLSNEELQGVLQQRIEQRRLEMSMEAEKEQQEMQFKASQTQAVLEGIQAIVQQINGLSMAMTAPKRIVKDAQGRPIGVEVDANNA